MTIQKLVKEYDKLVDVDSSLDVGEQTLQMFAQLKAYRNALCKQANSMDDILKIEYAYIVSTLNNRQKLWAYDYMTFPRRIGEMWESFCKAPFYNTRKRGIKPASPPVFEAVKADLKNLPESVWDIVGEVNMKQDIHFYSKKELNVIDFKSSFNSNEKGNVQRLKIIGAIYKMWKPKSNLYIFMRQGLENNAYLTHLEPNWNVKCGDAAYNTIKRMTNIDLRKWIKKNVRFDKHLNASFYRALKKQDLTKYLEW